MFLIYFFLFFLSVTDIYNSLAANQNLKVYNLLPGEKIIYEPDQKRVGFYASDVRIYCYEGTQKNIAKYFQTINLQIDIENIDDFTQYDGSTPEIVKEHYEEQKSLFSFNFFTYKKTKMRLDPFNQTCMGIETLQPYSIRLNLVRVDIPKLAIFCIALLTFFFASTLSKNALFYYVAGVSLGVCASFLILLYLAGKLIPRRSMMIGVLAGGSTLAVYVLRLLWDNIQIILMSYRDYVVGYVLITGFISFVLCYRLGPPKNKRSKDLIEWCLQFASLGFIYFTSYYTEASIAIMVVLCIVYFFPREWIRTLNRLYLKWFPMRRRYLTLDEFREQGIVETKKALEELRDYCSSPECKQWKVMTKLKNPKRFASFIEGEAHLMDEEIFDHDNSKIDTDSDDSEEANQQEKISDDEIIEDEEISDDEELYVPKKLTYRGASTSRTLNGSKNRSLNYRYNTSYGQENVSSSNNRFQYRESPYSSKVISPTSTRDSPYITRRMTPNNSRMTPTLSRMTPTLSRMTPNNSRVYRSYAEDYSGEES